MRRLGSRSMRSYTDIYNNSCFGRWKPCFLFVPWRNLPGSHSCFKSGQAVVNIDGQIDLLIQVMKPRIDLLVDALDLGQKSINRIYDKSGNNVVPDVSQCCFKPMIEVAIQNLSLCLVTRLRDFDRIIRSSLQVYRCRRHSLFAGAYNKFGSVWITGDCCRCL